VPAIGGFGSSTARLSPWHSVVMTFPSFPTGSTIRTDATLDDLLDWYHWAVAEADGEAFLLTATRQFPHWASDLFDHAVMARAVENLPAAPDLNANEEARLIEHTRSAAADWSRSVPGTALAFSAPSCRPTRTSSRPSTFADC
jgi:hypothetical protein